MGKILQKLQVLSLVFLVTFTSLNIPAKVYAEDENTIEPENGETYFENDAASDLGNTFTFDLSPSADGFLETENNVEFVIETQNNYEENPINEIVFVDNDEYFAAKVNQFLESTSEELPIKEIPFSFEFLLNSEVGQDITDLITNDTFNITLNFYNPYQNLENEEFNLEEKELFFETFNNRFSNSRLFGIDNFGNLHEQNIILDSENLTINFSTDFLGSFIFVNFDKHRERQDFSNAIIDEDVIELKDVEIFDEDEIVLADLVSVPELLVGPDESEALLFEAASNEGSSAAMPQDVESSVFPITKDGISVEKATIRWLSRSTGSSEPAKFNDLVLVPPSNTMPNQQWQLDFALSGKGFIEPGDLEITVPAYIWKDRNGRQPGRLTLAIPEEPDYDPFGLTWRRVGDTYVITNYKRISAGNKYMIQGTYRMTYPDPNSDKPFTTTPATSMVDIDTVDENAEYKGISDWLYADIYILTPHNQEELEARTNLIRATVNTKVEVTRAEKTIIDKDRDIYIDRIPTGIDSILPENPEDYYYVKWYIGGSPTGNQPYTMTFTDTLTDEYNGIMLGFTSGNNKVVGERTGSVDIYNGTSISTKSTYVWAAYPKSSFPTPDTSYTVTNSLTVDVVGEDDKIPSSKSAAASAVIKTPPPPNPPITYHINKVWEYNDDKYSTDLETIKERRPDSITVRISGCNFSDTLSDENEWHTEYTNPEGWTEACKDASESGHTRSSSTSTPRVYRPDGSSYYTQTYWEWYQRNKVYDSTTRTWTFYNAYREGTRTLGSSAFSSSYNKKATNHTNNLVRATTDRDLTQLRNNQDSSEITYSLSRSVYILPHTAKKNSDYNNLDNLHQNTVRFEMVDHTEYLESKKLTEDEYYFTFASLTNPTVMEYRGSSSGYGSSTRVPAEMWGKVDGEWIKFAEIDTSGNIETFNLATKSGDKIFFQRNNVVQTKLVAKTNADYISASYNVGLKIKPSEQISTMLENSFSYSDYIMMTSRNDATYTVYDDATNYSLNSVSATDRTYLHGRNYALAVDLDKETKYFKNDKSNRQLWFKNTITLHRTSTISNVAEFNYASSENLLADSKSGVFYDLLPAGMRVDESSVSSVSGVNIKTVNITENYKNSGRQLLIIEADISSSSPTVHSNTNRPNTYPDGVGWAPVAITFNMTYSYDEAKNRGLTGLRNHAAYVADEEYFGDVKYWSGEKDIPNGNNHTETLNEVRSDVRELMTDLSSSDSPNTIYAGSDARMTEVDFSALTSIIKQVSITGSDNWLFGHDNEVNVSEGGKYSYRITLTSGTDTTTKDIIILDVLENYTPIKVTNSGDSDIEVGKIISLREFEETNEIIEIQGGNLIQGESVSSWKGYFRDIDISEITSLGVDAKVYYSTKPDINITNYNPDGDYNVVYDILENSGDWSLTPPQDLSTVTAIAIDCRKDTNGNDFKLKEKESLIAYVHMKAPTYEQQPDAFGEDYKDFLQNAHAFNNVFMDVTQEDEFGLTTHSYDHFDFTQVGIYGIDVNVKKVWDDQNDNDHIRPQELEVELIADGVPTGKKAVLTSDGNWETVFEHVREFNDNDEKVVYTISEGVENYTSSFKQEKVGNLITITATNKHDLFKTNYPFFKVWESQEPSGWESNIPPYITVRLYADGVFSGKTQTVRANAEGEWAGVFTNLQKFKNGREIIYTVEELPINSEWKTTYEGNEIKNTYYPYGDLIVKKSVINSTPESKDNLFNFIITLKDKTGEDLLGEFNYVIIDENNEQVSSGEIKNGDEFQLKENWRIEIKDIPSNSTYEISEDNKPGYVISSKVNFSNRINADKAEICTFTNTYNTTGNITLSGNKTLSGRKISRNQFRFELYENDALIRTSGNSTDGTINFGTFTYDVNDNGKEFIYTIKEINRGRPGYTYDDKVYTVKVYPVDNGDGTMTVSKKIFLNEEEVSSVDFANEYHAEGETVLRAWKDLKGGRISDYGPFEFELIDNEGRIIQTKECTNDGSIVFDPISFSEEQVGNVYYYTIREKAVDNEKVVYDDSLYGYSVYVSDNGNGTLSLSQSVVDVSERFIRRRKESTATYGTVTGDIEHHTIASTYICPYPDARYGSTCSIRINRDSSTDVPETPDAAIEFAELLTRELGTIKLYSSPNLSIPLYLKFVDRRNDITPYPSYTLVTLYYASSNNPEKLYDSGILVTDDGDEIEYEASFNPDENEISLTFRYFEYVLNPNWQPTEGELPVFKNTLKDGNLSVSKIVDDTENIDLDKEFKFKVKLLGDDIGDKQFSGEKEKLPYKVNLTFDMGVSQLDNIKFTYLVNPDGETTLIEGELDSIEEPSSEGYYFKGWYTDKSFNTPFNGDFESFISSGNKRLYAKWVKKIAYAVYDPKLDTVTFFKDEEGKYPYSIQGGKYYYKDVENIKGVSPYTHTASYWHKDNKGSTNTTYIFLDKISPIDTSYWFYNAKSIKNLDKLDTSNVTNMRYMFYGCQELNLDVSNFDTSNVTDMSSMFWSAKAQEIDVSSFNTSNVTDMSRMFWSAKAQEIDMSSFNTSNVTDMSRMFADTVVPTIILNNFDTSNVTDMQYMFAYAKATKIDVSSFNTSKVTNMNQMFLFTNVSSLDLSHFNTSNVTDMGGMFCASKLNSINLGSFDTSNVTTMERMFCSLPLNKPLDLSNFDTSNVTTMRNMFGNYKLDSIDISSFDTSKVTDMSLMFRASNLENIYVSDKWNTDNVITSDDMFISSSKLPNFNQSLVDKTLAHYNPGGYLTLKTDSSSNNNINTNILLNESKTQTSFTRLFDFFNPFATVYAEEPEITFENGEAEFTLTPNEKITFKDIPAGTAYQVFEETPDGWVLIEQKNTSGEIQPLETSNAEFNNKYQPGTTSVQFNGTKLLDNKPAEENSFTFELYEGSELLETVSVLDGGFIQFDVISYTEAGTHNYTIKEVNPNIDTVDYDTHIENITVNIADNGDGTLSSEVIYDSDGIVFKNTTRPGTLEIKKNVDILTDANKDDVFTFEIEFTNENGVPLSEDENIYWYKKDANGNVVDDSDLLGKVQAFFTGKDSKMNESKINQENNDNNNLGNTSAVEIKEDIFDRLGMFNKVYAEGGYDGSETDTTGWKQGWQHFGVGGNVEWAIDPEKTLWIRPEDNATSGVLGVYSVNFGELPWSWYTSFVEAVKIKEGTTIKLKNEQCHRLLFNEFNKVKVFDLRGLDTSDMTSLSSFFRYSSAEEILGLDTWNTSKVTDVSNMFFRFKGNILDLTGFDTSNVTNMRSMFNDSNFSSLILTGLDTSNVTNMKSMFKSISIPSLDLSSFDTTNVTDMSEMFYSSGIDNLNISNWNTSKVTNTSKMFYDNSLVYSLNNIVGFEDLDTENVVDMSSMFSGCSSLESLDFSNFDTTNVTDMSWMFANSKVASLDLSNFNTSKVTNMQSMFYKNQDSTIDVSGFDTSKVTNMNSMFYSSSAKEILGYENFDVSNVTDMSQMFSLTNIPTINLSKFSAPKTTNMSKMFAESKATSITIGPNFNSSAVRNMASMFESCSALEINGLENLKTNNVLDMSYMFRNVPATVLDVSNFDTSNVTNMVGMFRATKAKFLDVSHFNTSNVTNMTSMFESAQSMILDVGAFDTSNVTNMSNMFAYTQAVSLDVSHFNTSKVTDMKYMFHYSKPTSLDLSNFDTSNVTDMSWMLANSKVTSLDLSNFNTSKVTDMNHMFNGSQAVSLDLSNFNTSKVTDMSYMFNGTLVESLDLSSFNTEAVTTMISMFNNAKTKNLNIENFNTSNLTERGSLTFSNANSLESIYIGDELFLSQNVVFPSPQKTPFSNGKWIKEDGTYGPYTATEIKEQFVPEMSGKWIADIIHIDFDANGGFIFPEAQKINADFNTGEVQTPSSSSLFKLNYLLKGWAKTSQATSPDFLPGYSIPKATALNTPILYAIWEYDGKNQININHDLEHIDENEYSTNETEVIRDYPGTSHVLLLKSYPGFYPVSVQQSAFVDESELVTVNYKYNRNRYTISFDGNGATSGQVSTITDAVGGVSNVLPVNTFSRKGYIFTGWNTEPDGTGTNYLDKSEVLNIGENGEDVILYAQWSKSPHQTTSSNGKIMVTCKPGETIVIPDLPFGTKYTIKEINIPSGWSLDTTSGEIGSIGANSISTSEFRNLYTANGQAYIIAHKQIIGDTPSEGQFTFELYQDNVLLQSKTNLSVDTTEEIPGDDGNNLQNPWINTAPVEFDALQFTQEDIGKTFTYTIKEINTGDVRFIYDEHIETVNISVNDAGNGVLRCDISYDNNGALFTNLLNTGSLNLRKTIENSTLSAEETEFKFEIILKDSAGNPIPGEYPVKIKHKNYGIITREENVTPKHSHTSNINDTGKQNGNYSNYLNTNEVISIPDAANLIVDVYYNGESVSYDWLSVWKGNYPSYKAGSNATFTGYVTVNDGAPNNTNKFGGSQSSSYTVNGNNLTNIGYMRLTIPGSSVTFGFKSDSGGAGKGYGYYAIVTPLDENGNPLTRTIQEEQGFTETTISNGGTLMLKGGEELEITGLPDGATYELVELDSPGWENTFKAGDTGQIIAGETQFSEFTNIYTSSGYATIEGDKTLYGGDIKEEPYEFNLLNENGDILQTVSTSEDGKFTFNIDYLQEDDGQTFHYYISEKIDEEIKNIEWDKHIAEVSVKVEDNGEGELIPTVTFEEGDLSFTNVKHNSLEISKEVTGNFGNKSKDFRFKLILSGDYDKHGITWKKGEETGEVSSNEFEFTLSHGDAIMFEGITTLVKYYVVELDSNKQGYYTKASGSDKTSTDPVDLEVHATGTLKEDTSITFTNDSSGVVPTEIRLRFGILSILSIVILAAIFILNRRRKLQKEV